MNAIPTYYLQPCPVCGRSLHVPVQLLGETAVCQHCRATFVARAPSGHRPPVPPDAPMERAQELLNACHGRHRAGLVESAMRESQF